MGYLTGDVSVFVISRFNQLNQAFLDYDYVLNIGVDTAWQQLSVSRCADGYDPDWNDRYYARVGPEPVAGSFNGPVLMGQKWLCIDAVHASDGAGHSLRLNGVAREVEQYNGTLSLNGEIDLGRYSKPGYDNHYLDGQIAEILVYNRALTSYEREEVEAYLKAKYAFNSAPEVDAGQDQQINEGQSAELGAVITDDGVPGLVTSLWSKVSGPGNVTFTTPSTTDSTVEFGECGAYVLRLTAYDGEYETSDEMVVTVLASLSTNVPSEGLRLWLKADDMPLSDGDSVLSWLDRSGLGHHLSPSTVDRAPVYRAVAVNGLPAIEFDGTDDSLAGAVGAITGNVSLIVVCRFNELHQVQDDYDYVLNIGEDAAWKQVSISRCAEGYAAGWDDAYYARLGTGAGSFPGPVLPGQKWLYIATVHSTSGVVHSVRLNGISQSAAQYSEALDLNGLIELGRFSKPGYDNHYLRGQIAETLVYDRALSASELEGIEAYLGSKYYPINAQPQVNAGEDQEILETQSVVLDGTVTDDGQPIVPGAVTSQWSKVNGPGVVTFNDARSPATSASFETTGAYLLRLTAYDGEYETSDDVQVTVSAALSSNVPSSGLRLWLKADELALDNGDAVLSWTDRSGQGHDMTQATQANAPVYATNVVGGRAAVLFDGSNDYLGGGLGGMTGDVSIITVFRFDQLSQPQNDYEYVLNMGEDVAWKQVSISRCAVGYDAAWDNAYYARLGQGAGSFVGPVLAGQEWMVLCAVHSTNGVSHSVWVDGYPMTAQQYEGTLQLDGKIELGRFSKPGYANHYLDGGIAEMMVYNRALDADEIGNVGQYLSTKYDTDWYTDPQIAGELTYSGPQKGVVHVFACTNGTDFISPQTTNLLNPGPYLITLASAGDYWLHAYRDSNGNASNDFWEAQGYCVGNPIEVNGSIENLDITLTDPDTDSDGLPDWWEMLHFGDLDETAEGDPDSDNLNNLSEYEHGTDPNNADTDGDGMTDGWEVEHGFNPSAVNIGDVVGWWKLDEKSGVIAADSINGKHGLISGAKHTPGPRGYGLKFDGADDVVSVTNSSVYKPEMLTVSLRTKLEHLFGNAVSGSGRDGYMVLLAQKNDAGGYAYALYKTPYHSLVFEIANSAEANATTVESGACFVYTGEWFNIVGTYDGVDATLYVNGELVASSSHESALEYDAEQGLVMGHGPLADDGFFGGVLDDVMILDVALDSEKVAALNDLIEDRDTDGDGLPDAWEQAYGLDPLDDGSIDVNQGANGNPSGDGIGNFEKFERSLDPNVYYFPPTDYTLIADSDASVSLVADPTNLAPVTVSGVYQYDISGFSLSLNEYDIQGSALNTPSVVHIWLKYLIHEGGLINFDGAGHRPRLMIDAEESILLNSFSSKSSTSGTDAGRGGDLTLTAPDGITIDGTIDTRGNNASQAGSVTLISSGGVVRVTGDVTTQGRGNATITMSGTSVITSNIWHSPASNVTVSQAPVYLTSTDGPIQSRHIHTFAIINGGHVYLSAAGDMETGDIVTRSTSVGGTPGRAGGNISIAAEQGVSVGLLNASVARTTENANRDQGGTISITAEHDVLVSGEMWTYVSSPSTHTTPSAAGSIQVASLSGDIVIGGGIDAGAPAGIGSRGELTLSAELGHVTLSALDVSKVGGITFISGDGGTMISGALLGLGDYLDSGKVTRFTTNLIGNVYYDAGISNNAYLASGTYDIDGTEYVLTPAVPRFSVRTEHSNAETVDTAFSVIVSALDASGEPDTAYAGSEYITWTWMATAAPSDALPVKPSDGALVFVDGVATADGFTLMNAGERPTITATATNRSGISAGVRVFAGEVSATNSTVTADPLDNLYANGYDTSLITVTLLDVKGNVKTGVSGDLFLATDLGVLTAITEIGNGAYTAQLNSTTSGVATVSVYWGADAGGLLLGSVELTIMPLPTPSNVAALTREVWWNIPGPVVSNLTSSSNYPGIPDLRENVEGLFEAPTNIDDRYGQRMFGQFRAPLAGDYTFWIAGDNQCELWMTVDEERDLIATVHVWTRPRRWTLYASQQSPVIQLVKGTAYPMEAIMKAGLGGDCLAVGAQFPDGRFERPLRARRFMESPDPAWYSMDTDEDGLSDYEEWVCESDPNDPDTSDDGLTDYEKILLGLNPNVTDTSGDGLPDWWLVQYGIDGTINQVYLDADDDGLTNYEEYFYGTDPSNADTSGDGINDYAALHVFLLDPTIAYFNGERVTNDIVSGNAATIVAGTWSTDGGALYSRVRNGVLEYSLSVQTAGVYVVVFEIGQHNSLTEQNRFDLSLKIDGRDAGSQPAFASYGQTGEGIFITPFLEVGDHVFTLRWHNLNANTFLMVYRVLLVQLGGVDNNENGTADWYELHQAQSVVSISPPTSPVSPVSLEGTSPYRSALRVGSSAMEPEDELSVNLGPNDRWHTDVPLDPDGTTEIWLYERYLEGTVTQEVNWIETNLLPEPTNTLAIRRGDALRLIAYPVGETQGVVTIEIIGVTNYVTTADAPVPHSFDEAGEYTVAASWAYDSQTEQATAMVHVVSAVFPNDPSSIVGQLRSWPCPALPPDTVLDYDYWLNVDTEPDDEGGTDLAFIIKDAGPRYLWARLGEEGPVLDSAKITGIYADNGAYWTVVSILPDGSRLVEVQLALGNVPDDIRVELNIFVGGALFEDMTLQKILTVDDFDERGVAVYRIIQSPEAMNSVCHTTDIYVGDELIGGSAQ